MQGNNNLRVLSGNSSVSPSATYRRLGDADLDSTLAQNGAGYGSTADSLLYNSLSLSVTLPIVALVDYIAQYNPNKTFGQDLGINDWISAVSTAFASNQKVDTLKTNLENGTTVVGESKIAQSIKFTEEIPTEPAQEGTLIIYYGDVVPIDRYDGIIYMITY